MSQRSREQAVDKRAVHAKRGVDDHLLRTMGAVPPEQRVLVWEESPGRLAKPLAALGFDVHLVSANAALDEDNIEIVDSATAGEPYPDEHFTWIVLHSAGQGKIVEAPVHYFNKLRRMLKSGGWLYTALPAAPLNAFFETEKRSTEGVQKGMAQADLAVAERPVLTEDGGRIMTRGIFRRVDEHTAP